MSIWNEELRTFRDRVASADPAPGGGSAAMVGAALGCGLVIMAVEISAAKNSGPELDRALLDLKKLLLKISAHADLDISAYEGYVAARRMPKSTLEEESARSAALNSALQAAAEAPVLALEDCLLALEAAERIRPLVSAGVLSDVGAGAALLFGGIEAALFTLDSNIRLMKDQARKEDFSDKREKFAARALAAWNSVSAGVERGLA